MMREACPRAILLCGMRIGAGFVVAVILAGALLVPGARAALPEAVATPALKPAATQLSPSFAGEIWGRRIDLINGIDNSLRYLDTPQAEDAYARLRAAGVSRQLVAKSLERFRTLLLYSSHPGELYRHLAREFTLLRSVGRDGRGTVRFTGYYQPTYRASRVRTAAYRYPIFQLPPDFDEWEKPHPTRIALEGFSGESGPGTVLNGLELAWLSTRYEAFMIHVQGSALLDLPDGEQMAVGYAANTDYRFVGFIRDCLKNKSPQRSIQDHFMQNPGELDRCLARNNRFIFFKEQLDPRPIGALGVPVTADYSIATDKAQLPPGALGLIRASIPFRSANGRIFLQNANRIVLDQDAGGAIKGPGRVDLFMGTGHEAGRRASSLASEGELYYLILKDGLTFPRAAPAVSRGAVRPARPGV